jgi:S-DNA-T family DNA segregation ATPase FtsK/SpoIIIE
VLRAYYAAGLGHPDKPDQQVQFGSTMSRDAMNRLQVVVDLPYGKTFDDVVKVEGGSIASGLDVTEYQVFLTRDKTSTRRHLLFVADRDPLAIPAGPHAAAQLQADGHLAAGPARPRRAREAGPHRPAVDLGPDRCAAAQGQDVHRAPAGPVRRPRPVREAVRRRRQGVKPDWRAFALVADRMVFGTAPTARDGDPVEKLIDMLRHIKRHIQRVNEVLSKLPVEVCPEGKLTRELARDPRYPELRVWMLVMEEFQVYYELDDQEANKEIAGLLSLHHGGGAVGGGHPARAARRSRAGSARATCSGFSTGSATTTRCASRSSAATATCPRRSSAADAYGEGIDASRCRSVPSTAGVGYLYGASDLTPTVRGYLADQRDAEKILKAARKHREQLGTLSGEAAGDVTIEGEVVDPLTDALAVVLPTEANVSFARLASRLADRFPERYGETTAAVISAQLRNAGARSKNVKDRDYFEGGVGQGVAREQLEELAARRAVSG